MLRIAALVALLALACAPSAAAWTWPADGPVIRPFALGNDPYAGGQHRGVDVGAGVGTRVVAPATGVVAFVGSVPSGGRAITIRTDDGFSVTLLQLAETLVARGDAVGEGAAVGVVGESADAVTREPHVHLGVRVTADEDGYVDPLTLLPARVRVAPTPAPVEPTPAAAPSPTEATRVDPPPAAAPAPEPVSPSSAETAAPAPFEIRASSRPEARARTGLLVRTRPSARRPLVRQATVRNVSRAVATPVTDAPSVRPRSRTQRAASPPAAVTSPRSVRMPVRTVAGPRTVRHDPAPVAAETVAGGADTPWRRVAVLFAFVVGAAAAARGLARSLRMMDADERAREDPDRGRMAVCIGPETHRPRRRVRRAVGRVRPLPAAQRQRRPHGERHRRARDAGDGRRRSGRRVAA
jgi:hypothetical protein